MRRPRRNSGDEEIRRVWKALVKSGGDDAALVERYLNLLKRREEPEKAERDEKEREKDERDRASGLLRQEYFDSVRPHAQGIVDDIRRGELTDRNSLLDRVTEESGNSYWAIYTHASQQALWASENADHGTEEGLVSIDEREGVPWGQLASWAFYRDLLVDIEDLGIDVNDDSEWPTPEHLAAEAAESEEDEPEEDEES